MLTVFKLNKGKMNSINTNSAFKGKRALGIIALILVLICAGLMAWVGYNLYLQG